MVNKMHPGQIILFLPCLLPLIAYCVPRAWAEQSRSPDILEKWKFMRSYMKRSTPLLSLCDKI